MNGRTLVVLTAVSLVAIALLVVIPGVQRGGWFEVLGVFALVALVAIGDRWVRRFMRRR